MDNLPLALQLAGRGWRVFPCKPDKTPETAHGYKDATVDPNTIRAWWTRSPDALIGIACEPSGIFAVDIDRKNGIDGMISWANLVEESGNSARINFGPVQHTPSGGMHLIFRYPANCKIPNNSNQLGPGLDLRSAGYICTGGPYHWMDNQGPETPLTDAPAWLLERIRNMGRRPETRNPEPQRNTNATDPREYWLNYYLQRARVGNRNDCGFNLACQLRDSGVPQGEALPIMHRYASGVPQTSGDLYTETAADKSLESAYLGAPARAPAHLPGQASNNGHRSTQAIQPPPTSGRQESAPEDTGFLPFDQICDALSMGETGDANLLAALNAGSIIYDHAESCWYLWQGHYWERDKTEEVYRLVTTDVAAQYLHAAAIAQKAGKDNLAEDLTKRAAALRNRKRAENALFLAARQCLELKLTGEEWDRDPWLLGVNNGVIELKTGMFRPGRPIDYIRAHAPYDWQGLDAPAPRFARFISEIFATDKPTIEFMPRLLGYGITGLTTEAILPILHGPSGRNGKTTLLETIGDVLGPDLASSSQADALMDAQRNGEGPQPFVYALRGKRIVWAAETNEGRHINAGLVKQLTGGDRLKVRTLHSKPVEFTPTHLVMLITNHKPQMPADDAALWDRVCLLPFSVRFVDDPQAPNERKRDKNLRAELLQEAPGILAWLVRGCLAWQREGLNMPANVKAATQAYREEEDTLAQWITERCIEAPNMKARANALLADYKKWCQESGVQEPNPTSFGRRLSMRFEKKVSGGVWYFGIGLLDQGRESPDL